MIGWVLLLYGGSVAAQSSLPQRMQGFRDATWSDDRDRVAEYFPERGSWSWTVMYDSGRVGRWEFPAEETRRVIGAGGPLCESVDGPHGEFGPSEGTLTPWAYEAWKRTGTHVFTPVEGRDPRMRGDGVAVEWRREDNRWVIAAIRERGFYRDGRSTAPSVVLERDTSTGPGSLASGEAWYEQNLPIRMGDWRYVKYGVPRVIPADELQRAGRIGEVPVYEAAGQPGGYLYVPTGPSQYYVYVASGPGPCG